MVVLLSAFGGVGCGRSVTYTKTDHPVIVLSAASNSVSINVGGSRTEPDLPATGELEVGFGEQTGKDAYITKFLYEVFGSRGEQILIDDSDGNISVLISEGGTGLKIKGNSADVSTIITFSVGSIGSGSLAVLLDGSDGTVDGSGSGKISLRAQGYDDDGITFFSRPLFVNFIILYPIR